MGLSNDLLSQFAKLTNKKTKVTETTVYGTVKAYGDDLYVQLDGSELLTPVSTTASYKAGERVAVQIKNHTATVTGNLTSPSARNADVVEVKDKVVKAEEIIAKVVTADILDVKKATIDDLVADNADIKGTLTAQNGEITNLKAKNVEIEGTLTTQSGKIETLEADNVKINESLEAANAIIYNLGATYATIEKLTAAEGEIEKLRTEKLSATDADLKYATIKELDAAKATIGDLDADVADINTLIFGSATGTTIQTSFANAVVQQIGSAQIKSAMIDSVSADKITALNLLAGKINSKNITIESEDGNLAIADETIQISDDNRVRVQIGKDASGDYSINIWDAEGKLMFSEGGLTENAVKDAIIRNDMVASDAAIDAGKLDIDSLFSEINGSSNTIKSSKVYLDKEKQTLDVAFTSITSDVTELGETISSQGTAISVIQGQITSKIWQQDIDTATDAMSTKYSTLSQDLGSFKTTVGATYATIEDFNSLEIGGRNLVAATSLNTIYSGVSPEEGKSKDVWSGKTINNVISEEYIVSFDAKADEAIDIQCFFFSPNTTLKAESSTGQTATGQDGMCRVSITTEWKRYWVRWNQSVPDPASIKNIIVGRNHSTTNTVYIRAVKFESGNKATDWSPAPEDISTRVASAESSITQLINSISLHTNEIDDLISRTGELEVSTSGLTASVSSIRTDLDDLSIGGRNLLLNTGGGDPVVMSNGASYIAAGIGNKTNVDGIQTYECSAAAAEIYYRFMTPSTGGLYGLEPGETYVISGKAKVSTSSGTLDKLAIRTQDRMTSAWTGGIVASITTTDSDEWVPFSHSFVINEEAVGYYVSWQLYYTDSWEGVVQTKELKLEKGTRATDWSPAPEDMLSNENAKTIYATKAELKVEADRIGANVSSIDDLTSRTGALELTASDFTVRFGATSNSDDSVENKIAAAQNAADAAQSNIDNISVGGRNLIPNTSKDEVVLGGYPDASGYNEGYVRKTIDIAGKNEYVLSFDAKSTVSGDIVQCFFHSPNTVTKVVSSTGHNGSSLDGYANVILTDSWQRYWVKYTQDGESTTTTKSLIVGRRTFTHGSGEISIRAVKFEEGNQPTDWTPAPEDVSDDISSAQTTADTARTEAANAAKTATNFMRFENDKGLIVGDLLGDTLGKNVLIDSDSVDIRNGDTILASYGDNAIYLAKNNSDAIIDLCNYAQMKVVQHPDTTIEWPRFVISSSNNLELSAGGAFHAGTSYSHMVNEGWSANVATSERIVSGYLTINSASEVSAINPNNFKPSIMLTLDDWFDNGADKACSELLLDSEKIRLSIDRWEEDYMDSAGLELIGNSSGRSQANLIASKIVLQGNDVNILSNGAISLNSNLRIPNNVELYSYNNAGSLRTMMKLDNYNVLNLGYSCYYNSEGSTTVWGNDVYLRARGNIVLKPFTDANLIPYYSAGTNTGTIKLHTSGYVTSSSNAVKFVVPLAKPAIRCSAVTVTTVRGFLLRQGNNYTHGSKYSTSGSTYAIPSNYNTSEISPCGNFVNVVATFSSTTNSTNNSPIGVDVELKITFS